ncbi:MAG: HAD family phosphatase [Dysgonamonadaceae bacterium]|jgi:HAD superfamily hydrolase (TIGR01509 family)|nr:HAD family phosphatase [Dysgonamonadaceae bacterium]
MNQEFAVLFDLDGVIIDTEPQYDLFWIKAGKEYKLEKGIEQKIKGTTLPNIVTIFLSHLPQEQIDKLLKESAEFETQMQMPPVPGVLAFLHELKENNIKIGLVTSSDNKKLDITFKNVPIRHYFDTIVSANRITHGKPHPMCYLLAAQDLGVDPKNCIVFEDSFHGIQSGNNAGMKVVGLSTTNPEESIKDMVWKVIPDFKNFTLKSLL